jgi:hypothetical protein
MVFIISAIVIKAIINIFKPRKCGSLSVIVLLNAGKAGVLKVPADELKILTESELEIV